jgi:hypothetical protein
VAPRERQHVQPGIEELAIGERRTAAGLRDAKPVDREPAAEQVDVDSIDSDRPVRDRLESSDRDVPRDRREGIEYRRDCCQQNQQDACDHDERPMRLDVHGAPR